MTLDANRPEQTLITNVNVFDGASEELIEGASVLIEGKLISQVSTEAIDAPDATNPHRPTHQISCGG